MKHLVLCLTLLFAPLCLAQPKVETGDINGAKFRVDVPENWNGILILYCHGYNPSPGQFDPARPNPWVAAFPGYAFAQSGYAAGGWAISEAVADTGALRRHFIRKYGAPKQTFVMGHSMGGFLTMLLVEQYPSEYSGGLALCGPLAPATWFMTRRVFDMAVVFAYYFPDAMPSPAAVPADFAMSAAVSTRIEKLLDDKPDAAAAFRRYTNIKTNKEAAGTVSFFTYILKDLQQRGGGNPFDNRNTIYDGSPDDNALNDGVKRYTASPRASEYLRTYYTPTGKLTRPLMAIHTTYDPLVPPWVPDQYQTISELGGGSHMFVQKYVKRDGHCAITPQEIGQGFGQLVEWATGGKRPE